MSKVTEGLQIAGIICYRAMVLMLLSAILNKDIFREQPMLVGIIFLLSTLTEINNYIKLLKP